MRENENILYIEVTDLVQCGFSRGAIDKYTSEGNNQLKYIKHKGAKLFPYETLGKRYKDAIQNKFNDPYEYIKKYPIKNAVVYDLKAEQYFISLTKNGLHTYPDEWISNKTKAASWLNMLANFWGKAAAKNEFNIPLDIFIKNTLDLIKSENIDLPNSEKRLKGRLNNYIQHGYESLVNGNAGKTSNAAKVNDEASEAKLLSLIEHPNQYDDALVCCIYNVWAKENGYKELKSAETVGARRRTNEFQITIGRYGSSKFNEKFTKQIKGFTPTRPGMLWESDDNNLDFYFNDPDPLTKNKNFNRYVSYIVADSYCGLVLGKSYRLAKSPVVEMVRLAYIDAMYYVRSLTGSWHLPFEVKADRWQASSLYPFLGKIGKIIPPAHANKHRGYIEQLFGSPHFKRCQKLGTNNYNGNNVTAVHAGVNLEALQLNEKNRPFIGSEAEKQIELFFNLLRKFPDIKKSDLNAVSKEQKWLNKWATLSPEQKRPISDEQFLMIFGVKHEPQGRQITITNRGIEPQINGIKYSYDLPDCVNMMPLVGEKVSVVYDPYDMNRVLITNNKNIRFVAKSAILQPRALGDACVNSRHMLNVLLSEKKEQVNTVVGKSANRKIAISNRYNSEEVLLSAYQTKEVRNEIENDYLLNRHETDFEAETMAFIDSNTNFNRDWDKE